MFSKIKKEKDGAATYSRNSPSPAYQKLISLYREMHQKGNPIDSTSADITFPGISLLPHIEKIKELIATHRARTLLDYGSGKGLEYSIPLDIPPDNKLISSIEDYWGTSDITLYDPGYEPYETLPEGTYDGVIATDVLEHCPEEDLLWILEELFKFSKKFIYLNISCMTAVQHLPNGKNAHVTVKPPEWWKEKIARINKRYPSIEVCATYTWYCRPLKQRLLLFLESKQIFLKSKLYALKKKLKFQDKKF